MTGTPASLCIDLPALCVIQFQGADAVAFLHAQVTNDVDHLSPDRACLAAYCTAKGRTLATMVLWRPQDDTVLALVRRDLADGLTKRLRMFVLRSKVTITLTELQVQGVTVPQAQGTAWDLVLADDATLIYAPGQLDQQARAWRISTAPLPETQTDAGAWNSADILAGLPWIGAATQDMFIPQTLNLDLIDAINFRKGCYPGQEVVARSHYRGTVKRRMAAAATDALPATPECAEGADVWLQGQPDSPAARIINSAWHAGHQRLYVLLEVQWSDLAQDAYHLQGGQRLHVQPLPYALPELKDGSGTA